MKPPAPVTSTRSRCIWSLRLAGFGELLEPRELQQGEPEKRWVVIDVAAPQAARLLPQPEGPLKPGELQEQRCPLDATSVKIERGAHSDDHLGRQSGTHLGCPALLFRGPQAHPNNVRTGTVDPGSHVPLLDFGEGTKRRTVPTGDLKAREALPERDREPLPDAGSPAIKEMADRQGGRRLTHARHQRRTAHPLHSPTSLQAAEPHKRHPVRCDDRSLGKNS